MTFNCTDINTFKAELENSIAAVQKLRTDSHTAIKIQSLLNITIYVLATRFLEGSVKHIIYNCCIMRGDSQNQLSTLDSELKKFNNPEFSLIRDNILKHLNIDITKAFTAGRFSNSDITFLNEIVRNRHRNAHANYDPHEWYSQNLKDITDFHKEYIGLINILKYLDCITYNHTLSQFTD
jgi:hypothetical protein